jgi:hypothetical protein
LLYKVFPNIRELFQLEKRILENINNIEISKICIFMINDIYLHIIHSDYGLYFKAAYLLSVYGGEEERKKIENYVPIDPPINSNLINFSDYSVIDSKLEEFIDFEELALEDMEIDESKNDCRFVDFQKDENYSEEIKISELSNAINSKILLKEKATESDLFLKNIFIILFFVDIILMQMLMIFVMILMLVI